MTTLKRIYPNPCITAENKGRNAIAEILQTDKVFDGYWGGSFISPLDPAQSMLDVARYFGCGSAQLFWFEFAIDSSDYLDSYFASQFIHYISNFFGDYQTVYAVHCDPDKTMRCHLLVNTINYKNGHMLEMDNDTIQAFYHHIFFYIADQGFGKLRGSII